MSNEQVICVDDRPWACNAHPKPPVMPIKNSVYTIVKICRSGSVVLAELPAVGLCGVPYSFCPDRFRPIDKPDPLAIFRDTTRKIEDDQFDKKPERIDA